MYHIDNGKSCLTCEFWSGKRYVKNGKWETDNPFQKALCNGGAPITMEGSPTATGGKNCPNYVNLPAKEY